MEATNTSPRLLATITRLVCILAAAGCIEPSPLPSVPTLPPSSRQSSHLDPRIYENRPPQALPPISGGTLFVNEYDIAVVSDPDRDRVVVVDLARRRVQGQISVPQGEPGRIAEDGNGRFHVLLRGTGELLSFDPERLDQAQRRPLCRYPRGIDFVRNANRLVVTCRDGWILYVNPEDGSIQRRRSDVDDLRDVIAYDDHYVATRFRSAELVDLDGQGHVKNTIHLMSQTVAFDHNNRPITLEPNVAWRMRKTGNLIAVAHQVSSGQEIELSQPDSYGGAFISSCQGLVRSAVSLLSADDLQIVGMASVSGALPVDVAVSPNGERVALVLAGEQGESQSVFEIETGPVVTRDDFISCIDFPSGSSETSSIRGAIAVAYTWDNKLVVQQRDPAILWVGGVPIHLGGPERFDAGHAIFHGNAGLGLACASCHPEGGDDGRIWRFSGFGALRTPALHGGLLNTAPFHWHGDLPTIGHLVDEVFERRMGGPVMGRLEQEALARWLNQLPASRGREGVDAQAVERGARLFWGEARCGECHGGPEYTNNQTMDVGTGGAFQVPPLIGVSFRLPVMHNGCAKTLLDRFDPACGGGDRHGTTSHLSREQIADLIAYMETL
ncbi:MAG: cytochrome-c peroxidase [Sandaracinaceae bacterium]|nr:cytochrome-c peroxidase [Sandaracinaceae bacterium]